GEAAFGDLRHTCIEIVDEDQVPGVPSVLGPLLDEDVAVFCELPHGFSVVGEKRRRRAKESCIPRHRAGVVGDRDPRQQINSPACGHPVSPRTSAAPATIACNFANATSRLRYFIPQSGATTSRLAGT